MGSTVIVTLAVDVQPNGAVTVTVYVVVVLGDTTMVLPDCPFDHWNEEPGVVLEAERVADPLAQMVS
jgi:hypothetical protein